MATQIDQLQIKTGLVNFMTNLLDGEPVLTEDEGNERLYVGTVSGNNVGFPNNKDLSDVTTTANNAVDIANTANINASDSLSKSNVALNIANTTQNQVANIITSNGSGKDTELVDIRTDANGTIWTSAGLHIRNLDKAIELLKNMQTFTATADNTSSIPISTTITSLVDISKVTFDVFYEGILLSIAQSNYSINTTNATINLIDWTIKTGDVIEYRVHL